MAKKTNAQLESENKELKAEVGTLEAKNKELKAEVGTLEAKNKKLQPKNVRDDGLKGITLRGLFWVYAGKNYDTLEDAVKAKNG